MSNVKRRLGEIVYVINEDGTLGRSIVSTLKKDGDFEIFHPCEPKNYSFDYQVAVDMSKKALTARRNKLENELNEVKGLLLYNGSPRHKKEVDAAKMAYPNNAGFLAGSDFSMLPIKMDYIEPGEQAFVVLTPSTAYLLNQNCTSWPYFVIQVEVRWTRLTSAGVSYETDFCARAFPSNAFRNLEDAKRKLMEVFTKETGATLAPDGVKVVLREEAETSILSVGRA